MTELDEAIRKADKHIISALKLQELVKERIRTDRGHKHYEDSHDVGSICLRCSVLVLQSLVDESER